MTESAKGSPNDLDRMVFFSDAVIAIAITLLALELPVPELDALHRTESGAWHELFHTLGRTEYLMFLISFFVIGGFWRGHHALFKYVTGLNRSLLFRNQLFLFAVILIPVVSKFFSALSDYSAGAFVYAVAMVTLGGTYLATVRAVVTGKLLPADTPPEVLARTIASVAVPTTVFAVSIGILFVFGANAATWSWLATGPTIPLTFWLLKRRHAR